MKTYHYQAYTKDGSFVSGYVEALDQKSAINQVYQKGLHPFETNQVSHKHSKNWWHIELTNRHKLSDRDLAIFTRELATLLKAEIPLDETLRICAEQSTSRKLKLFCESILDKVVAGSSLAKALANSEAKLPTYYCSLVEVGEVSGALGNVFGELAKFIEHIDEVKSKLRSALIYPVMLLLLSLGAIIFIATFLIPTLLPIFEDSGAPTPFFIDLVLGLNLLVTIYWLPLSLGLALSIFAMMMAFRLPTSRFIIDKFLLKTPIVGKLIIQSETGRLSRSLAILLKQGITLVHALGILKNVANNQLLKHNIESSLETIKEGEKLHKAFNKIDVFPDLMKRLVKVGEETGRLDDMLFHTAHIYETQFQRSISSILTWFTPVVTLIMGVGIGGLMISVMTAILSVNEIAFQ